MSRKTDISDESEAEAQGGTEQTAENAGSTAGVESASAETSDADSEPNDTATETDTTAGETPTESKITEQNGTEENGANAENLKKANGGQVETKAEKRYGLVRFLQLNPQPSYIEALLRSMYADGVMTQQEWISKIKEILERRVR